nr:MAG TPA: hypothetical protein [Caudoviricetes sp.]
MSALAIICFQYENISCEIVGLFSNCVYICSVDTMY